MSDKSQNEESKDNDENIEEEEEKSEKKIMKDMGSNTTNNNINDEENKENEIKNDQNFLESNKLEEENEKEDDNNKEISQGQINLEIAENKKKDQSTQKDDNFENNTEEKNDEITNENNDIKENNDNEENKENEEEKKNENDEETEQEKEIRKILENLKPICLKTKSLSEQLKELINAFKKEIQDSNSRRSYYAKQLNAINKETRAEYEKKISITEDMRSLENVITIKLNRINEYNKIKRGKNSVERNKKDLFNYRSSEDLLNIKQMQLKNVSKLNSILDKDISKINSNLKRGFYLDHMIKEENPQIKTKADELNYIYNKLITDISMIKNEIHLLKNIRDSHNKCDKQIAKLNQEYESLKVKKDMNIYYNGIKAINKEMKEIRRKQIIENKSAENIKFKNFFKSNVNINNKSKKNNNLSSVRKKSMILKKKNNSLYLSNDKKDIKNIKSNSFVNSEMNNKISNERYKDINIKTNEVFDKTGRNKEESLEKKYKYLLQLKIEEKNKNQRKINFQIKEMNIEKSKKEAELTQKETKKFSIQKSNFNLENIKKINEHKIKRLKKELSELKMQEQRYDRQIVNKEEALTRLKKMVDSVKSMKDLKV